MTLARTCAAALDEIENVSVRVGFIEQTLRLLLEHLEDEDVEGLNDGIRDDNLSALCCFANRWPLYGSALHLLWNSLVDLQRSIDEKHKQCLDEYRKVTKAAK